MGIKEGMPIPEDGDAESGEEKEIDPETKAILDLLDALEKENFEVEAELKREKKQDKEDSRKNVPPSREDREDSSIESEDSNAQEGADGQDEDVEKVTLQGPIIVTTKWHLLYRLYRISRETEVYDNGLLHVKLPFLKKPVPVKDLIGQVLLYRDLQHKGEEMSLEEAIQDLVSLLENQDILLDERIRILKRNLKIRRWLV